MMKPPRDPRNVEEWRAAMVAAELVLKLRMAKKYGLVDGEGRPDVDRCEWIIGEAVEHISADIDARARERPRRLLTPAESKARNDSLLTH